MNYTADRALQIAVEMERFGQTFYESLAVGCGNAEIATLAATLAKSEESHAAFFKRMRESLPPSHRGPQLTEKELFEAARELRNKIIPNASSVREAVLAITPLKALDMAIKMEANAVAYYYGLTLGVDGLDATVLTKFVNEEKGHLRTLQDCREQLFSQTSNGNL